MMKRRWFQRQLQTCCKDDVENHYKEEMKDDVKDEQEMRFTIIIMRCFHIDCAIAMLMCHHCCVIQDHSTRESNHFVLPCQTACLDFGEDCSVFLDELEDESL